MLLSVGGSIGIGGKGLIGGGGSIGISGKRLIGGGGVNEWAGCG